MKNEKEIKEKIKSIEKKMLSKEISLKIKPYFASHIKALQWVLK